jgi:RNA polymerase sigma factor (sigma-70 family)
MSVWLRPSGRKDAVFETRTCPQNSQLKQSQRADRNSRTHCRKPFHVSAESRHAGWIIVMNAEDVIQDAMVSAFTHIAQFDGRAKLSTWLSAIVINAVRMQMRRRRRQGPMFSLDYAPNESQLPISELLADPRPTPEKILERLELYALIIKLTRGLAPSQRTALRLYQQNGHSIKKLAKNLGVPQGTMKANLARGRAKLAERFHKVMAKPKIRGSVTRHE